MKTTLKTGDPVKVTSGVYAGIEGIIEDLQPECSAVRIHTQEGRAYALIGTVERIVPPMRSPKGNVLKK